MTPLAQLSFAGVVGFSTAEPMRILLISEAHANARPLTTAVNYAAKLLAKIHKPGVVNAYAAWVFLILLAILIINRLL